MNLFLAWDRGRFFPHETREKKEWESLVERMSWHRHTYIQLGLAFAMCFACFIPIYLSAKTHETAECQNEIPTPKQQITNKIIKVFSHIGAIINETKQPTNEIKKINISVYDSGTNIKLLKTTQAGREKFSDTNPEAFAPPQVLCNIISVLFPTSCMSSKKQILKKQILLIS